MGHPAVVNCNRSVLGQNPFQNKLDQYNAHCGAIISKSIDAEPEKCYMNHAVASKFSEGVMSESLAAG
jgi:hypothetical protein